MDGPAKTARLSPYHAQSVSSLRLPHQKSASEIRPSSVYSYTYPTDDNINSSINSDATSPSHLKVQSLKFIIPDTYAFERMKPHFQQCQSKVSIKVIEIFGYEAYFVEQWISKRTGNNMITTYTGNPSDKLTAYRVTMVHPSPVDNPWPSVFVNYINRQNESSYSVATETEPGTIFITNLALLDPVLSLVSAPSGEISKLYKLYVVNYNLKKLGCGSRSAITIAEPTKSVEDKFKAAYKIANNVPFDYAVCELISILQTFLYYFNLIDPVYCDGLYCEKTEHALKEWWKIIIDVKLVPFLFKQKPANCDISLHILSILGFTLLCRSILEMGGNNFSVPKDPMDVDKMRSAIKNFQKYSKLHKEKSTDAGFLDSETVAKLIGWAQTTKATQNFTKDLSKVKNIFKNTVIDITSGKNLQTIAMNSSSPLHQASPLKDQPKKYINCQDTDQVKNLGGLGKQLSFLFEGKGNPIDLDEQTLSAQTIKYRTRLLSSPYLTTKDIQSEVSLQSSKRPLRLDPRNLANTVSGDRERERERDRDRDRDRERDRDKSSFSSTSKKAKSLILGGSFQDQGDYHNLAHSNKDIDEHTHFNDLAIDDDEDLFSDSLGYDSSEDQQDIPQSSTQRALLHSRRSMNLDLDNGNEYDGDIEHYYGHEHGFEYDYEEGSDQDHNEIIEHNLQNHQHQPQHHHGTHSPVQHYKNKKEVEFIKFNSRLNRRHSIPCVDKELNIHTIDLQGFRESNLEGIIRKNSRNKSVFDNSSIINEDKDDSSSFVGSFNCNTNNNNIIDGSVVYFRPYTEISTGTDLKRSVSFSVVEDSLNGNGTDIFGYEDTKSDLITTEWLTIQYLKMLEAYKLGIVKRSSDLKKKVREKKRELLDHFDLNRTSTTFSARKNESVKVMNRYFEIEDKFRNSYKMNARLKYELRLLLQKTKEVESNLKTLQDFKIATLKEKIDGISKKFEKDGELPIIVKQCNLSKDEGMRLDWEKVFKQPHLLIYFCFHYILYFVLSKFDGKRIEETWKEIDKDQSVTRVFENLCKHEEEALRETAKSK